MADLDEELARFQAEISSVEAETAATTDATVGGVGAVKGGGDKLDDELALFEKEISEVERAAEADKGQKQVKRSSTATVSAKPVKRKPAKEQAPEPEKAPPPSSKPPTVTQPQQQKEEEAAAAVALPPPPQPYGALMPPAYAPPGAWIPPPAQAYGGYQQDPYSAAAAYGGAAGDPERMRMQAEALASVQAHLGKVAKIKKNADKVHFRQAAGTKWVDPTLSEWPEDDHRIFVGDLGNEVNDEILSKAFQKYPSFIKAKVVRDKRSGKSKGFGFVSFAEVEEFAKAMREMNGKYIGNRPCKLSKSTWNERSDEHTAGKKRKQGKTMAIGPAKHGRKHLPMVPREK